MIYESSSKYEKAIDEHIELFNQAISRTPEMAIEIERVFLIDVSDIPVDPGSLLSHSVRQGYLAIDGDTEVRVRLKDDTALLTIKKGSGMVRIEEEIEIPRSRAEVLFEIAGERTVEKTRYLFEENSLRYEIDLFHGALSGLALVEVEFPNREASDSFAVPAWFGKEVTEDPKYMNRNLAVDGLPVE